VKTRKRHKSKKNKTKKTTEINKTERSSFYFHILAATDVSPVALDSALGTKPARGLFNCRFDAELVLSKEDPEGVPETEDGAVNWSIEKDSNAFTM
jgi:hypothetical protein